MKLVNLTPHDIHILMDDYVLAHEPEDVADYVNAVARTVVSCTRQGGDEPARVRFEHKNVPVFIDGIQTFVADYKEVVGLPEPQEGVTFITSAMVAERVRRSDVVSPGHPVRDEMGRIIACIGLQRWDVDVSTEPVRWVAMTITQNTINPSWDLIAHRTLEKARTALEGRGFVFERDDMAIKPGCKYGTIAYIYPVH